MAVGTPAVPLKVTVCVLGLALSVRVSVPASEVTAVEEVNVTLMVQVAPAFILVPQLFVSAKLAFGDGTILVKVRAAVPESVTVTVWGGLVVPTATAKVRVLADSVTAGVGVGGGLLLPPPPPQLAKTAMLKLSKTTRTHVAVVSEHCRPVLMALTPIPDSWSWSPSLHYRRGDIRGKQAGH